MIKPIIAIPLQLLVFLVPTLLFPLGAQGGYLLVVGSYRQGTGAKPEVSGITSPSLYAIPMKSLAICEEAGKKITEDIYKPVRQFDNRWSCIYDGKE